MKADSDCILVCSVVEPLEDNVSMFSTKTVVVHDQTDIHINPSKQAGDEEDEQDVNKGCKIAVSGAAKSAQDEQTVDYRKTLSNAPSSSANAQDKPSHTEEDPDAVDLSIPKQRLCAHHDFVLGKTALLSIYIEHAREFMGVVQLSAELFCLDLILKCTLAHGDKAENIRKETNAFNKYVQFESEMEWSSHCINRHSLTPNNEQIKMQQTLEWSGICSASG